MLFAVVPILIYFINFSGILADLQAVWGVFAISSIVTYFINFSEVLSDSQADWGAFGDYFGGVVGTLFNLIAVIFSLVSIYVTLKIAKYIHKYEQGLNEDNYNREIQKQEKEIELLHKQNKPFPYFEMNGTSNITEILISNQGPGTLIIKKWSVICEDKEYKNFEELLEAKFGKGLKYGRERYSKLAIASGLSIMLLSIPEDEDINIGKLNLCNNVLSNSKIKIVYEDIFENEFEKIEELSDHK